jgi:hypothetical protein
MQLMNAWIMALPTLILAAGIAQNVLIVASLAIPRVLGWREETAKLRPLTRQIFWTYAGYIWGTNLCFGLLSTFGPELLLDHSPLAGVVTAFMAAYWAARLIIQFTGLDRCDAPAGLQYKLAEAGLVSLFLFLTLVYTSAFLVTSEVIGS